ncbi:sorting nexin 13 [Schistosoma haematobium]|uniref:Sorting nexin 13 n=1 Tax=Schistosoma haematobium TaxID=6185 RepID=A0A922LHF4_SCHHA|nr:sorting nexin 13 [Schistosoma haematobium]KAH9583727.1 sorting nexin 13 [Schistosoma haematobium]
MLRFNVVLGITVICFLLHHGFTFIFYVVIATLSFAAGFFLMNEQPVVHFRKRDLLFSKGIPKVTAIMDAEGVTRPNIRVSPHQDLDYVLNQIMRNYFLMLRLRQRKVYVTKKSVILKIGKKTIFVC